MGRTLRGGITHHSLLLLAGGVQFPFYIYPSPAHTQINTHAHTEINKHAHTHTQR